MEESTDTRRDGEEVFRSVLGGLETTQLVALLRLVTEVLANKVA